MILLFQLNKENDSVDILFDKDGLIALRTILNKEWKEPICDKNEYYDFDHEHLTSKDWGGNELTPEFTSPEAHKIEAVKIVYVGEQGEQFLSE
jgi:hypothetical protein